MIRWVATTLAASLSLAGSTASAQATDPAATSILQKVDAKWAQYPTVQLALTVEQQNAQGKTLALRKGTLIVRGRRFNYVSSGYITVSDAITTWQVDVTANELRIAPAGGASSSPFLLLLLGKVVPQKFIAKLNGEKKVGARTLQELELTPVDKAVPFFKIYAYVDKATTTFQSMKILYKNGGRTVYTVNSLNSTVATEMIFMKPDKSKFPGIEEVSVSAIAAP